MNFYKDADEKRICKDALQVQDACNISGVLNSYWGIVCRLRELNPGYTSYDIGKHAAIILFHDKLEDMMGVSMLERTNNYASAYTECKRLSNDS